MKLKHEMYRQGEIYLKKINSLPAGLKEKNKIIRFGETTGHAHQFKGEGTRVYDAGNGLQYAVLEETDTLMHEEHEPITLEKGTYIIGIQREYDPVEGIRQVMD